MNSQMNPPLQTNDRIMLLHMEGESSVTPGTKGTVSHVGRDPFEPDEEIIAVLWDNGSSLSLLSSTDAWKKIPKEKIEEQNLPQEYLTFRNHPEIFEHFDWRWLRDFLYKMRDTGIVNMFGAAPLIYAGKNHIDRYYGEGKEDDEEFQEFLDMADEAKDKMVQGILSYMEEKKLPLDDMDIVNSLARRFSNALLKMYITF